MSKGQDRIPTASRLAVQARDKGRCLRCTGRATETHHRRSRGVRDEHRDCVCNLAALCRDDHHDFAHKYPAAARGEGYVISKFNQEPWLVPVSTPSGWIYLNCDGTTTRMEQTDADESPA